MQQTAVLVEGRSDEAAITTLAVRRGLDLAGLGVQVVAMGGATSIGQYLRLLGPAGRDWRLAGLCDAGEEAGFRHGLERAGFRTGQDRAGLARLGFFVCVADLEDELIRALGPDRVEQVIEVTGELSSFRTFQRQPAQRDRAVDAQLRRFMGTRSGRKIQYASLLAGALDLNRVPEPLHGLLRWACG